MLTTTSTFTTQKASGYLQQMCKHFAHKVDVSFDHNQGHVEFPAGTAELTAKHHCLTFTVRARSHEGLERVKAVLENHIVRFAFRENLDMLEWS